MPPGRKPKEQLGLFQANVRTAPCVPAIRTAVEEWRARNYRGATDTSQALLNYWFLTDHRRPTTRLFRYHDSQREAIETLIYLFEVAEVRRHKDLVEHFATNSPNLRLL